MPSEAVVINMGDYKSVPAIKNALKTGAVSAAVAKQVEPLIVENDRLAAENAALRNALNDHRRRSIRHTPNTIPAWDAAIVGGILGATVSAVMCWLLTMQIIESLSGWTHALNHGIAVTLIAYIVGAVPAYFAGRQSVLSCRKVGVFEQMARRHNHKKPKS